MSRLLFMLPMTLMALSAQAEPGVAECEARAARVVAQLDAQSALPLTPSEARLAHGAALAACRGDYQPPDPQAADATPQPEGAIEVAQAPVADPEEPQATRFERFVTGLFTMDTEMARKRPGGKYRYLEKED